MNLNQGLPSGTIDATSKAPLAANFYLEDAAHAHSRWMLDYSTFSHTGAGGSTPADRMYDAGYRFTGAAYAGENISVQSISTASNAATAAIYTQHKSLFLSSGHRTNILSDKYAEIGIGQVRGYFDYSNGTYFSSMITQNFAKSGTTIFVTGVVYDDLDGDDFYSVGEGLANVDLKAGALRTESLSAGGYQIPVGTGVQDIILGNAVLRATILNENAKIDLVDGVRVDSSVSLSLVSGIRQAQLLGTDNLSLAGSASSDVLTGNKGSNAISGGRGNDKIYGGTGNDTLRGDDGNDRLYGDAGNDKLYGGKGDDALFGSAGNDTMYGDDGRDTLSGGAGSDKLIGGEGADKLLGGNDNDTLNGGASVDLLTGGLGSDILTGGTGADTFIFTSIKDSTVASSGRDTIKDFSRAELDRIDLSAIDANTRASGNQAFKFIGANDFSGTTGELRFVAAATSTMVYGDVDGDGRADFSIRMYDGIALRAGDFIL